MNSCSCVNWIFVRVECFLWKEKSAPSSAARTRRAPCLVVCERGVCVFGAVGVCVGFEVGVYVGYGFPLSLWYEGVRPGPVTNGHVGACVVCGVWCLAIRYLVSECVSEVVAE